MKEFRRGPGFSGVFLFGRIRLLGCDRRGNFWPERMESVGSIHQKGYLPLRAYWLKPADMPPEAVSLGLAERSLLKNPNRPDCDHSGSVVAGKILRVLRVIGGLYPVKGEGLRRKTPLRPPGCRGPGSARGRSAPKARVPRCPTRRDHPLPQPSHHPRSSRSPLR